MTLPDADAPRIRRTVSNQLNRKIVIEARDHSRYVLAPLETRDLDEDGDEITRFALRCWTDDIHVEDTKELDRHPVAIFIGIGFGIWFAVAWAVVGAVVNWANWWIYGWIGLGVLILVCGLIDLSRISAPAQAGEGAVARWRRTWGKRVSWMRSWGGQQLYLALGILIGFALPATAIFFAANALQLIDQLRAEGVQNAHAVLLTVIGRVMQVTFVAVASLTPALLFFLFDREHLDTLRTRFLRQIMRFDPTVKTRQDVVAKYGKVMSEAYGRDVQGRILPGRRSPLLLATLLIALGWTFTLLHGDVEIISERGITALFEPRLSAVTFAFLGAYFYGLNVVLRGYVRKDLRAKTYSALTVRILVVVPLAWVLEMLWTGTTLYVIAFLAGIFPETALVLIKETLRGRLRGLGNWLGATGEETDPLTKLEGIDLYDLARLFDEGVTNVQGLAHDDIVELMLQTRIPAPRILDWLDQAILYLHAGPAGEDEQSRKQTLATLRTYGIRTATDLDNAFQAALAPDRHDRDGLMKILPGGAEGGIPRIQVMKDTINDAEWMINLRSWRAQENVVPEPLVHRVADIPAARLRRELESEVDRLILARRSPIGGARPGHTVTAS